MLHREESPRPERLRWLPGHLVVSIKADAVLPHMERAESTASLTAFPEQLAAPMARLRRETHIKSISVVADPNRAEVGGTSEKMLVEALAVSARESDSADLQGVLVLDVTEKSTASLAKELSESAAFDFAEPFPARWPAAQKIRFRPLSASDPERNVQWHLRATRWFEADRPDAKKVTVAVLDTGIDAGHPHLKSAIDRYEHFHRRAEDIVGHGTHVAGIIGGRAGTDIPMRGLADCRLAVWKVFQDRPIEGEFYIDPKTYLTALRAVESTPGIAALNLSIGGYETSEVERILFRRILGRGIAVVAAMGNEFEEGNPIEYPAAYDDIIAVGAIDESFRRAYFSNTGAHITLSAPGQNILSAVPRRPARDRWETHTTAWDGTSMATPQVTAAVALLRAQEGAMDVAAVTKRLVTTASTVPEMKSRKRTHAHGAGLLDLRTLLGRKR